MSWDVYHHKNTSAPETDSLVLNTPAATSDAAGPWNDTAPTSTVISSQSGHLNTDVAQIAYCWHGIQGFSKFGSYTGNGNADGAFVFCGFRPAFLLVKNPSDGTGNWIIHHNKNEGYNVTTQKVYANRNLAESNEDFDNGSITMGVDFLSNGFKWRVTGGEVNSTAGCIYVAFAEAPFVNSNGVPGNAR
jgi:hypothetical protein